MANQPQYSDAFINADNFTAAQEGTALVVDSNGFLTKYGINQKYHPDVDVRTLTPEQARAIRYNEYWVPLNADTLANKDPKIAMMAYDTAILAGVETAKKQVIAAGGDPSRMYELRLNYLKSLASNDPKKNAYLTTWVNRTNALANATKTVMSQTEAAPEKPEPTPIEQAGSALQKGISGAAQAQEAEKPVTLSPLTPAPQTDISPLTPDRTTLYQAALARSPTARVGSASAPTPPATAVSSPVSSSREPATQEPEKKPETPSTTEDSAS